MKLQPTKKRLLLVAVVLFLVVAFLITQARQVESPSYKPRDQACRGLQMPDKCIDLEVADSNEKRLKGLSGRESLDANAGMLFVFDKSDEHCIWMKDMQFSIDVIWLNDNKEVLKIEQGMDPNTYPKSFCSSNTKYVIELTNGQSQALNINIGDKLLF